MNKISVFFNFVITALSLTFLVFCWCHLAFNNTFIAIVISIFTLFMYSIIFFMIKGKTDCKKNIKQSEKANYSKCKLSLKLSTNNQTNTLFSALIGNDIKVISPNILCDKDSFYIIYFDDEIMSVDRFLSLYKTLDNTRNNVTLYTFVVADNLSQLINNIKQHTVSIMTFDDIYKLFKEKNLFPVAEINTETVKTRLTQKLIDACQSKMAVGYSLIGVFLLLFSFITPFRMYYQVFASCLILFAIIISLLKLMKVNK